MNILLDHIYQAIQNKKIEFLLKKHNIQLKHYLPGRIRLALLDWQSNEQQVNSLLQEINEDQDVTSVEFTKETGSLLIHFNHEAINNPNVLNRWLTTIQKYI